MKVGYVISFLLIILIFMSCKDQTFKKTKNATKTVHPLDGSTSIKIKSYTLTYNPKASGFITLRLENGAEYTAKTVDGGSFSSTNSLLNEPGVLFDTVRKEVVVNKYLGN